MCITAVQCTVAVYNAYDPRGVNAVPQSTGTKAVLLVHVGYNTNRLTTVELSSIVRMSGRVFVV